MATAKGKKGNGKKATTPAPPKKKKKAVDRKNEGERNVAFGGRVLDKKSGGYKYRK